MIDPSSLPVHAHHEYILENQYFSIFSTAELLLGGSNAGHNRLKSIILYLILMKMYKSQQYSNTMTQQKQCPLPATDALKIQVDP